MIKIELVFLWYPPTYFRTDLCSRHFVFFVFCSLFLLISWHTLSQQTISHWPLCNWQICWSTIPDPLSPIPDPLHCPSSISWHLRAPIWRSPMIIDHATQTGIMWSCSIATCAIFHALQSNWHHTHQSRGLSKLMSRNLALGNAVFEVFDLILLPFSKELDAESWSTLFHYNTEDLS